MPIADPTEMKEMRKEATAAEKHYTSVGLTKHCGTESMAVTERISLEH